MRGAPGVLSLRCPSRFSVYFFCSVFLTTRISTHSRSYENSSLGVRIWSDPPPHLTRPKKITQKINSFYNSNIWHLRNNKFVCFVFWTGFRLSKFSIIKLVVWPICNLLFMRVCIVGYVTITVSHVLKYIDYW